MREMGGVSVSELFPAACLIGATAVAGRRGSLPLATRCLFPPAGSLQGPAAGAGAGFPPPPAAPRTRPTTGLPGRLTHPPSDVAGDSALSAQPYPTARDAIERRSRIE